MSQAWAKKNNTLPDAGLQGQGRELRLAQCQWHRPYKLISWQPDQAVKLIANPDWWDKPGGNVTELELPADQVGPHARGRIAVGDVDLVTDLPPADFPRLKDEGQGQGRRRGPETRTIFFVMDQSSDEIKDSSVRAATPSGTSACARHSTSRSTASHPPRHHAWPLGACCADGAPGVNGYDTALDAPQARPRQGQETAGRCRLRARPGAAAALPQQPLRQRRADLPGGGFDVGQVGVKIRLDLHARSRSTPRPSSAASRSTCLGLGCVHV